MNKLVIQLNEDLASKRNKLGVSVLLFAPERCVCVICPKYKGADICDVYPFLPPIEIVDSLEAAQALGADTLLFGVAPKGGAVDAELLALAEQALSLQLKITHGFHQSEMLDKLEQDHPGEIENLRLPQAKYLCKTQNKARLTEQNRILMVGTDMACGKMTAGLKLNQRANELGLDSELLATGQTGIVITGKGVPLDAIKLDFTGGAIEKLVLDSRAKTVIIEGQGSIINPASSATLPLIRGSAPTHLVLCHDISQTHLKDFTEIVFPPLSYIIKLYEDIAAACGLFERPITLGICVNSFRLPEDEAQQAIEKIAAETGKVVVDPVRDYLALEKILAPLKVGV